jgi:hypothetical protein
MDLGNLAMNTICQGPLDRTHTVDILFALNITNIYIYLLELNHHSRDLECSIVLVNGSTGELKIQMQAGRAQGHPPVKNRPSKYQKAIIGEIYQETAPH